MQVSAQAAAKKDQLNRQQETDGARMGLEIAKHRAQMQQNKRQSKESK
jgi:hypothetical protein